MKYRILFVCLGNICRSPAAEEIFRDFAKKQNVIDKFEIDSAGTYGGHSGELPDARMRAAAAKRGYKLIHRSRKFVSDDFDCFDKIIVMDDDNYETVCMRAPTIEATEKVCRMTDFSCKFSIDHVPDPYYEGADGFEYVLDILEDACENLLNKLL